MKKTITLPSGKIATFEKGKGKDLLQAQIKAQSSEEIIYALIAELAEIDGQKLVYEDILEMDLADVVALQGELSGKFQNTQIQATIQKTEAKTEEKLEITTPLTESLKNMNASLNSPTPKA